MARVGSTGFGVRGVGLWEFSGLGFGFRSIGRRGGVSRFEVSSRGLCGWGPALRVYMA